MNILEEFTQEYEIIKEDVDRGVRMYKIRGVMGRANYPNKNRRVYPMDVMQESVRSAQEAIQGNRFLGELDHPCLIDKDFDVLSEDGWKKFEDLSLGESVATFNENNVIEYQPIETIIDEPYSGEAYAFKGRNIDSSFTGGHRFYLEDRNGERVVATAKEIFENRKKFNKHKIIKTGTWIGEEKEKIVIPGVPEEEHKIDAKEDLVLDAKTFMAFMGIWLSEGCIENKKGEGDYVISISLNEGAAVQEIREVLVALGLPFVERKKVSLFSSNVSFKITDVRLWKYLNPLGDCYTKHIPKELKQLEPSLLEELLYWFAKGDGGGQAAQAGTTRMNLFSTSKKLVEDLHEILIKTGGSGNWTEIEAKNKSTLYQLNLSTTKGIYLDERFLKIEEINHEGNIYCITVPNGNFYMKQNNKAFLTGNSSPKINMEKISHKIISLSMNEAGIMLGEMIPAGPCKDKLISLIEDKIGFGVSTRGTGVVKPYSGPLGEGLQEVSSGYSLKAIDIVHNPSANAFPNVVKEETENFFTVPNDFKKIWNEIFKIK